MIIHRIVHKQYQNTMFDPFACAAGSRWLPAGLPVLYACDHPALILLEHQLAHPVCHPADFVCAPIVLPKRSIKKQIPEAWYRTGLFRKAEITQRLGLHWYQQRLSLVLEVPSTILPNARHYLINPQHKDYSKLTFGDITPCTSA